VQQEPRRALRLAVFHHNVEQVRNAANPDYYEPDFLHNANDLLPHLAVQACLHGHTHLPVPGERAQCGTVCFGAGSFGVNARYLPGHPDLGRVPRQFGVVVFERTGAGRQRARLWTRQCVPDPTGRYRWDPGTYQGHSVALTELPAIRSTSP